MPRDYDAISRYNEEQLGKDRKSRMSQVAMYADTAHFVFELLQNADDAGATEIEFRLNNEGLVVEHNGKAFNEDDVRAISYFGKGKTDVTAIGHFGLGFKSVFAYTASPRVHSSHDDFELVDLYTLRGIDHPTDLRAGRTRFVLPFDHEQKEPVYIELSKRKKPAQARAEIGSKLKALGGATLLFTRTLKEIQWSDGKIGGQYLRDDALIRVGAHEKLRETLIVSGDAGDQYFLVNEQVVSWPDESGRMVERRPIAIAIELDNSYRRGGRVGGDEAQKLWVFFPTDKETHTGIIVQGPYRTTPARDNVPADDDFNRHLVAQTAALLANTLSAMKPLGVVGADLLSRLPIDESKFEKDSFFRPLYDAVRKALRQEPLLPTNKSIHVPAERAKLARGQRLVELISRKQLSRLFGKDNLEWLDTLITADRYPVLYRYLVGVKSQPWSKEWDVKPLVQGIEVRVEDIADKLTARFMDEQTDAWVIGFYLFLHEGRGAPYSSFIEKPIIRLENGRHVPPVSGPQRVPNAYLPTGEQSELPTVKKTLVKDKRVVQFLKELGLSTPDITDEVIETVLPRYTSSKPVTEKVWKRDFAKILGALACENLVKRWQLEARLKETKWLLVRSAMSDDLYFVEPGNAYVPNQELLAYFQGNEHAWFLADGCYTEPQVEVLVGLGVSRTPRSKARPFSRDGYVTLQDWHGSHKRGTAGFDPEWTVDGLEEALAQQRVNVAAFVWNRIAVVNVHLVRGVIEVASRKTFERAQRRQEWSSTGELLRDTAWLPDRKGAFHQPAKLMPEDLPTEFDRESLQAKRLAEALAMRLPEAAKAIDALSGGNDRLKALFERLTQGDLDDDVLDRLEKLLPRTEPAETPAKFSDAVRELHRTQHTGDAERASGRDEPVRNPERYQQKLREQIEHQRRGRPAVRVARFNVIREREDNKDARQFLYQQYHGACQVTGQTFKKADGSNYFVTVTLVPYQRTEYLNHSGNMLCLSAEMAARFMYGAFEWIDDIGTKIEAFKTLASGGSEQDRTIRVRITGQEHGIKYSEPHFLRLKALWAT